MRTHIGRMLSRHNRFEALEPRCMLSASATVTDVDLASTASSSDFVDHFESSGLGADGSSIEESDQNAVSAHVGARIGDAGDSVVQELDGSGTINSVDTAVAIAHLRESRPNGNPVGAKYGSPTTSGFDHLHIDNAAVDMAVALYTGFHDEESADADLSDTVVENTNAGLLTTVSVDDAALILGAVDGASGRSKITRHAADEAGLFVDSVLKANFDSHEAPNKSPSKNQPPQIVNAYATSVGSNTWVIQGEVSDPDDALANLIVEFTGEITMQASVGADGTFQFAVVYPDADWGWVQVRAVDPHGAESDIFTFYIGFGG